VVGEAVGAIPVAGALSPPALNRGYAVASTDSGHRGRDNADASFGVDQQARLDFAYASIGEVSREARALIAARHGRAPERAYFMGCSNGGRSAMMAAQRFPTLFDGIVAGAPAFRLTRAAVAQIWDTVQFLRAAPRNGEGQPILAEAFSDGDLRLIAGGALRACDAADGLADGSIDAMASCRFDPASLRCPSGEKAENCLSGPQVEALRNIFDGARDGQGRALYAAWPWDAGIASPGWRAWKLGTSRNAAAPNARNATLGPPAVSLYFLTPPAPDFDALRFDFDRDPARTAQTAAGGCWSTTATATRCSRRTT
jgi:pimeloyl-ACP methyl ester carboxylesterase